MSTSPPLVASSDALVRQNTPTQNWASRTYLIAGEPVGNFFYSFVYFNRPFPLGATIVSAKLVLRQKGAATGGTRTVTVRRAAAAYSESKLTYSNQPGVTGATATLALGNSATDGRPWEIDVTALMQEVADGAAWYGFRVGADLTTTINFYSREASVNQPTLEIEWADSPNKPVVLAPSNGRAVSIARPTLRFDFTDVSGDTSMSGYQLQMNEDADDPSSPDYDSGTIAANIPEHLVTFDIATAENWHWRVRTKDGAGLWSDWSAWTTFTRTAKPTVTITSPAASPNDFVTEGTPPFSWTATGQVAYQLFVTDPADATEVLWASGKVSSTDNSVSLPDLSTPVLSPDGSYKLVVRVWDSVARESTPGDPVYTDASRNFTFNLDDTVDPVSSFTVTADSPRHTATLGWTRATAPDSYTILRDGVAVATNLDAADLLVSGTTYAYVDATASPRGNGHEWSVIAVVDGVSSDDNPTDTAILEPLGVWLSKVDGSDAICLWNSDLSRVDASESSAVHEPLGADNPVLITQARRGRAGQVDGVLYERADLPETMSDWLAAWEALRTPPGQTLVLVSMDSTLKVFIYNTLRVPADEFVESVPISFNFRELI